MPARLIRYLIQSLLLAVLVQTDPAGAQGFTIYSGRNHPELTWQVAATEHFRIVYPIHLEGIAEEAAPVAEASYTTLSTNLGVTFEKPIRIYLSDEDEITNGFAVRVGNGHTNIWVHQNDPEPWTGPDKWLRRVIAHELAHLFHYRAIRSNAGILQFLMANPIPPFWAEGIAQYQTETWNAQRGDRWLRTAVLDDRLSYTDGASIWNGNLMYALGHSQVRYFASEYGDTALAQMLDHREKRLLGLFRVHDFGSAMKATIDKSYRAFYDDWRRHVNVYYNTLAGQMESIDSLATAPISVPGSYVEDLQFNPDTTWYAAVVVTSVRRPVRRLVVVNRESNEARVVAEGAIGTPVSWSPDGTSIAFSRRVRGPHGSLLNDLFLVRASGGSERRLTRGRRATTPTFAPDGRRLAFAASSGGTANVFTLDLDSGLEEQITHFEGDTQIAHLRWQPGGELMALSRFGADGTRDVVIVNTRTGEVRSVTSGEHDNRSPIWNPEGTAIAYTSLRDDVPNVFVRRLDNAAEERVTRVAVGASATHWLPPDTVYPAGRIALVSNATGEGDRAFLVPADRRSSESRPSVPPEFAYWTEKRPPDVVPVRQAADPSLIESVRPYRSVGNITHAFSLALPYYNNAEDWGIFGMTSWIEPLGKHIIAAVGGLSIGSPGDESFFAGTYVNNQLYPSIALTGYRFPGSARVYGNDVLLERYTGADVVAHWPVDWRPRPYTATDVGIRVRLAAFEPVNLDDLVDELEDLPAPERGQQADLALGIQRRFRRPYAHNVVHPLDGLGFRLRVMAAGAVLGTEKTFVRGDAAAYAVLGDGFLPALHRVFVYGRAQAQEGASFSQDYLGFSRHDEVRIDLPGIEHLLTGDAERVRGYRRYAIGNRVLFGSVEYRVPVLPSLQTRLLGVVSLGATTLSGFADGGMVWSGADLDGADRRVGAGVEMKNALRLGKFLELAHALGIAWPLHGDSRDGHEVYYRIRTALPF